MPRRIAKVVARNQPVFAKLALVAQVPRNSSGGLKPRLQKPRRIFTLGLDLC